MADDVAKLKVGQQPKGVEVKPPAVPIPTPPAPRPAVLPSVPSAPASTILTPAALRPPAPPISVPETKTGPNKLLLAGIVVVLLLGAGAGYFMFLTGEEPQPTLFPSPTATPPVATDLRSIFSAPEVSFTLTASADAIGAISEFNQKLDLIELASSQFKKLAVNSETKGSFEITPLELMGRMDIPVPQNLSGALASDSIFLAYGQLMGTAGQPPQARPVLIFEVANEDVVRAGLSEWNQMVFDLAVLMQYTIQGQLSFSDGMYRDVPLRYVQIPDRYWGLSYALVGKYLVVASSKDSFELAVDTLLQSQ